MFMEPTNRSTLEPIKIARGAWRCKRVVQNPESGWRRVPSESATAAAIEARQRTVRRASVGDTAAEGARPGFYVCEWIDVAQSGAPRPAGVRHRAGRCRRLAPQEDVRAWPPA